MIVKFVFRPFAFKYGRFVRNVCLSTKEKAEHIFITLG